MRINADDFGISPGVNSAIEGIFQNNKLHSASIICGCGHFEEAIAISRRNPNLKIGLHFNLTTGDSIAGHQKLPLLTNKEGKFKNGFLKILLLSIFKRKKLLDEAAKELSAQIFLLQNFSINLHHIDGHRHIHFIPGIFQLVVEMAQKHDISKVRVINENLFSTWSINYPKKFLWNGGIIKWFILRVIGFFNGSKNLANQEYFFSILYTGTLSKDLIKNAKFPRNFSEVEIMIHPGNPRIDRQQKNLEEKNHLLHNNRNIENRL